MPESMDAAELRAVRLKWGLTQLALAKRMGINRRAYIHLEMGDRSLLAWHIMSLERISIDIAVERADPSLMIRGVRYIVDHLVQLELEAQQAKPPSV